jgi:hypothetical protein
MSITRRSTSAGAAVADACGGSGLGELIFRPAADITRREQDGIPVGILVAGRRRVHETAAAAGLRIALLAGRAGMVTDPMIDLGAEHE